MVLRSMTQALLGAYFQFHDWPTGLLGADTIPVSAFRTKPLLLQRPALPKQDEKIFKG